MKYIGVISLLVIYVGYVHAGNATWGLQGQDDILLFKSQITESAQWTTKIKYNATFPLHAGDNSKLITQVRAFNMIPDHDGGGEPALLRGGPNHKFVTVIFTSHVGRGLHFHFEVWGRK